MRIILVFSQCEYNEWIGRVGRGLPDPPLNFMESYASFAYIVLDCTSAMGWAAATLRKPIYLPYSDCNVRTPTPNFRASLVRRVQADIYGRYDTSRPTPHCTTRSIRLAP